MKFILAPFAVMALFNVIDAFVPSRPSTSFVRLGSQLFATVDATDAVVGKGPLEAGSQDEIMRNMSENVIESWNLVREIPNYEEAAGALVFRRMFSLAPETQYIFKFAREFELGSEELYQDERFKRHAKGVVATLDTAVSMLAPDLDPLEQILREMGSKHAGYGTLPEHYAVVERALMDTLETVMADKFTPKVKTSWARFCNFISTTMIEGAEQQ